LKTERKLESSEVQLSLTANAMLARASQC